MMVYFAALEIITSTDLTVLTAQIHFKNTICA